MMNRTPRRALFAIPALLLGLAIALGAQAQPVQKEMVQIAFTGEVTAVDVKAGTVSVRGANGEAGVFEVDPKLTTIMSGSQDRELASLHKGEWIAIDANTRDGRKVATLIQVVEDPSEGSAPDSSVATAAGATVEVRHNKLSPALVQIAAGQTVTFHNLDKMPGGHTVMATDGSFSSPALEQGQDWTHSFDVPGVYPIHIKEHPGAEASIVVE